MIDHTYQQIRNQIIIFWIFVDICLAIGNSRERKDIPEYKSKKEEKENTHTWIYMYIYIYVSRAGDDVIKRREARSS